MIAAVKYTFYSLESANEKVELKNKHLQHKKEELSNIMADTEKDETALLQLSEKYQKKIEDRLLNAYRRIRNKVKNGLAVVNVERGASAGSFFTIPPQVQMEITSRKKIITDEHSGRILIDNVLSDEVRIDMEKLFKKLK